MSCALGAIFCQNIPFPNPFFAQIPVPYPFFVCDSQSQWPQNRQIPDPIFAVKNRQILPLRAPHKIELFNRYATVYESKSDGLEFKNEYWKPKFYLYFKGRFWFSKLQYAPVPGLLMCCCIRRAGNNCAVVVGIHLNLIRGTWPRINQSQCSFCWGKV